MTNDQPLSRRAARLAQQAEQGEPAQHDGISPAPLQPAAPSSASFAASRPSAADAIDYRTEVRPRVPRYEPAPLESAPELPSSSPLAPPFAPPTAPAPDREVRSRDFRPRSDRAVASSFAPAQPDDAHLDYRTQGGPLDLGHAGGVTPAAGSSASARSASAPLAPSAAEPAVDPAFAELEGQPGPLGDNPLVIAEYTMTRRELRALREAQAAQAGEAAPAGETVATDAVPTGAAPVEAEATDAEAMAAAPAEAESADAEPAEQESADAAPADAEPLDPFEALLSSRPSAPAAETPTEANGSAPAEEPAEEPAPVHLWQPTSSGSAAPAPLIEPAPLQGDGAASPSGSTATGSHWSTGFSEPADDPFENTFSRQVGSASVSTNALVLPEMPTGSLTGAVPGTGEIIITGMVEVPTSIASTGAVPSVHDSPDIDELLDAGDREFVSTDSAPVSAINAVSSHTATRNVIAGRKPRGNALTTVLIVSTVVMAVAAVTIFVVAAVNGLF